MTTTNTNTPPAAARYSLSSVIWEDGSSFDYENGYSSNGAVRDKNRTKPVRYTAETRSKNGKYFGLGLLLLGTLLVIASLIAAMFFSIAESSKAEKGADRNNAAIKEYLVKHEGLYVVKMNHENQGMLTNRILIQNKNGQTFNCAVEAADNEFIANAYVFCQEGAPATFTVSLPEKVSYHGIFALKR